MAAEASHPAGEPDDGAKRMYVPCAEFKRVASPSRDASLPQRDLIPAPIEI